MSVILYYIRRKTAPFCLHTVAFAPLFLAKRQMGSYGVAGYVKKTMPARCQKKYCYGMKRQKIRTNSF